MYGTLFYTCVAFTEVSQFLKRENILAFYTEMVKQYYSVCSPALTAGATP